MIKFLGVATVPLAYAVARDRMGSYRLPLLTSCVSTLACTAFSIKFHLPAESMPFVPEIEMGVKQGCATACVSGRAKHLS